MHSAYISNVGNEIKENLLNSLDFINWKNQINKDSTVFIKPNFTFPYYKEGIKTMSRIMKGFDSDDGVLYVDRPEDRLKKASVFIKSVSTKKEGRKAIRLVEKYSRIMRWMSLRGYWRDYMFNIKQAIGGMV